MLKHGRIDIVQMLRDLPATKHYTDLMEVDIVRASVRQTHSTHTVVLKKALSVVVVVVVDYYLVILSFVITFQFYFLFLFCVMIDPNTKI